ncbi:uncharacterized protein LOC124274636 [Haliotis rubra]|uniref:uncharacterized protein LOC124274636 n=1 Tax=Haliotis rubra TaxID=36100 RepID=UPI001EE56A20|nr:uncharacterized protein LOC124274636 [Haliotis rubra]
MRVTKPFWFENDSTPVNDKAFRLLPNDTKTEALLVYAFSDNDDGRDLQITLVQNILHEETAQEHLENIPGVECPELPVISYKGRASRMGRKTLQSSSNIRSVKKTAPGKASRIAETEEMVESYLQKRRHNNEEPSLKPNWTFKTTGH